MKEAIAQAFIVNIILTFFVILILLFFGSISYSRAFKAKNRIINIIEENDGWGTISGTDPTETENKINKDLAAYGYDSVKFNNVNADTKCSRILNEVSGSLVYPNYSRYSSGNYSRLNYCVIEHEGSLGKYYTVVTVMPFTIPIIGTRVELTVKGETKEVYSIIND